jgi:hypothetical protein
MKRKRFILCATVVLVGVCTAIYFVIVGGGGGQGGKAPDPDAPVAPKFVEPEEATRTIPDPAPEFDEDGLPYVYVMELPKVPEQLLGPSPPIDEP